MIAVSIPNNIKAVLDSKGLTPYALAKMLKKHPNHVYALVSKETLSDGVQLRTIVNIAKALNVPVDELIKEQQ